MAPELVCLTGQYVGEEAFIQHVKDPSTKQGLLAALKDDDLLMVGQHVAYDFAVVAAQWPDLIPWIWRKYDKDLVTDTKLRQQLLDIAAGCFRGKYVEHTKTLQDGPPDASGAPTAREVKSARWVGYSYDLDSLTRRCSGRKLDKDTWRLRYGEFIDTPLENWPEGARTYPLEDARATLEVFLSQEKHVEFIPDQFRQARAAFALHLTAVWGLRTFKPGVDKLEAETLAALEEIEQSLKDAGLVRYDGSRDTKRAQARIVEVCARDGLTLRLTDGGKPSLDNDACKAAQDELLGDYAELTSLKAVLAKDLPMLRSGTYFPVHTSFGLAGSGRTTSAKPNVQNPRRLPGIREAFIPREGKVFAQADFATLELYTLAQVCLHLFGKSELADALNAGLDPHTDFAASIIGVSYEEGLKLKESGDKDFDNARQTAKVANFGFPGGLGFEKLVLFARKTYKVILTVQRAKELKAAWLERWPEMRRFFDYVSGLIDQDTGKATIKQLFSDRWRGEIDYTPACNTFFQGLGADAAKRALYLVTRACYAEPDSVLYGSRPVNFVHDEVILETDDGPMAHEVAVELGRLMKQGADEFLPDVPSRIEPILARRWSKKSKAVFKEGRLVPWDL
jgi:hypothetical protein